MKRIDRRATLLRVLQEFVETDDYHRTAPQKCLGCGVVLSCHVNIKEAADGMTFESAPEDAPTITVCDRCGTIMMIDADGKYRRPTPDEQIEMQRDPAIWETICALKQIPHLRREHYEKKKGGAS